MVRPRWPGEQSTLRRRGQSDWRVDVAPSGENDYTYQAGSGRLIRDVQSLGAEWERVFLVVHFSGSWRHARTP